MRRIAVAAFWLLGAVCVWGQTQPNYAAQVVAANPDVSLGFGDASGGFKDSVAGLVFAPSTTGTVLYGQPSTLPGRKAASLTYDAYATAPNASLGNFDWSQPWWAVVDVNPQVNRSGSTRVELFSKGVPSVNLNVGLPGGVGYEAYLQWDFTTTQACLNLTSAALAGGPSGISACSGVDVPNGVGLTIAFTYDGSGTAAGIGIYVNGIETIASASSSGTPTAFSMATPGAPLYLGGDSTNYVASQGANVHNTGATVFQAFAMGRGALSAATIQSLAVHDRFWAQVLPAKPATPEEILWDNDGCQDSDNMNSLATAIRLTQLGYLKIGLVNDTDWTDYGAAMFRQMLDQGGLHQVPVSSSQGQWAASYSPVNVICQAKFLTAYSATYLPRAKQMTDAVGYRTALAAAPDASVQIVLGGGMRGVYDLLTSGADAISPMTGAQLFAAKVTAVHMMANIGAGGDGNIGEDYTGFQYVLANTNVPLYFYGTGVDLGNTGPGADVTRTQQYPFVATIASVNGLLRASWDMWPLLGALDQGLFWNVGTPGTVTLINNGGGTSFAPGAGGKHYVVTANATWGDPNKKVWTTWLLNSLINANPEPPVTP